MPQDEDDIELKVKAKKMNYNDLFDYFENPGASKLNKTFEKG